LIADNRVKINGEITNTLGIDVSENDQILIDNNPLIIDSTKVYYLLNKPSHCISSTADDRGRETVLDFIEKTTLSIFPVGRLDFTTTGLMVITNDGDFANILSHPHKTIPKKYRARVKGVLTEEARLNLEKAKIRFVKDMPAKIKKISYNLKKQTGILEITIYEGKNHQIKKMMESVGLEVLDLERIEYAIFKLKTEKIQRGQFRMLTPQEIKNIKSLAIPDDLILSK